jgi:hypothetical protein
MRIFIYILALMLVACESKEPAKYESDIDYQTKYYKLWDEFYAAKGDTLLLKRWVDSLRHERIIHYNSDSVSVVNINGKDIQVVLK